MLSHLKKYLKDPANRPFIIAGIALSTLVIITRTILWSTIFPDFTNFLNNWLGTIRSNGLASVGGSYHNYNSPYLYFIGLFSLIIPDNLSVIKLSTFIIDIILAIGVYKLVAHFNPPKIIKFITPFVVLLLPTAILNSAAWGQCDNILAAFFIWSIYFAFKNKLKLSWALLGLSFAFKMQGIFLAPFLLYLSIHRRKNFITGPLIATTSAIIISLPPLLTGHTIADIIDKFIAGTNSMSGANYLTCWLPNIWQFVSNDFFHTGRIIGIILGIIALAFFAYLGIKKIPHKPSDTQFIIIAALGALILPFVLPLMHDRYYFQAEILLTILAITTQSKPFLYLAIALQISAILTFIIDASTSFHSPTSLGLRLLTIIMLFIICHLSLLLNKRNPNEKHPTKR